MSSYVVPKYHKESNHLALTLLLNLSLIVKYEIYHEHHTIYLLTDSNKGGHDPFQSRVTIAFLHHVK